MSLDEPPQIRTDLDTTPSGHVARITIDRPERLNVLNTALILQLTDSLRRLSADDDLRCVVLRGAGEKAFIGGADINEMAELDADSAPGFISQLHAACTAIRELPVPAIASIRGYCLGAGLEIAVSCDLRVSSDDAIFGMPEVKVGIPSVIEAALLPRLIGPGKARQLVYTGEPISAAEAGRCGLVDRVVAAADLNVATLEWVQAISAAGPSAIRLQKRLASQWDTVPLQDAIQAGIQTFAEAYETDEPHRLMQGFLDRPRRNRD